MTNEKFREKLELRTTNFAIDVFKYLRELPNDISSKVIGYQLGKSASSIGANYYEANRAESKEDFIHKVAIALKEANETVYWFSVVSGLLKDTQGANPNIETRIVAPLKILSKEAFELRNLLQSIVSSSRKSK